MVLHARKIIGLAGGDERVTSIKSLCIPGGVSSPVCLPRKVHDAEGS